MTNDSKKEIMFQRMREKKKEIRIVRRIVFAITLLLLIAGVIGVKKSYTYITEGLQPMDPTSEEIIQVEIPIGSGLDRISNTLEENGIIKNAKLFKYYAKFNNESNFQAGTYDLTKAMTLDELIESLKTGKVYRKPVFTMTIPEGLSLDQIAELIEKRLQIPAEDFLTFVNDQANIDRLMSKYPRILTEDILDENVRYPLEGYLFPATYPFYEEKPTINTIVETMIQATSTNVIPYLTYLDEQEKSVHWLLTFASLVEKEATAQSDREAIASVFNNRMAIDMLLQTDPTVAYAHGEHLSQTLYVHLEIDNPYNTYKYTGLPPGPIANAGKSSIEAVIFPEKTPYLYFLADKEGKNHFAENYEEHLRLKAQYIDSN
jgi:UPF0755 protein